MGDRFYERQSATRLQLGHKVSCTPVRATLIILALGGAVVFGALTSCMGWHTGIRSGQAVPLGSWRFEKFEFQVWQRRTEDFFEPFATGLFVRCGTNSWQVFCLDIQDRYAPRIELRTNASEVRILRSGRSIGIYDTAHQAFRKGSGGALVTPMGMGNASEPPGMWWLPVSGTAPNGGANTN